MGDVFRGWRRKSGVVTLVIALVLLGGWIRSSLVADQLFYRVAPSTQIITSGNGVIEWQLITDVASVESLFVKEPMFWISPFSHRVYVFDGAETTWSWRWQWCGFDCGEGRLPGSVPRCVCTIPYWFAVLPLTLLSAFLLLVKRQVANPKIVVEN